jgi:LPXTG-motif cell wall-anchored protein
MVTQRATPRIAPLVVGVALLAAVMALSVLPNTGAVSAASNCQYGVCTNSGPSTSTWLIVLGVLLLIALALFVLIMRGRQKPQGSPQEWEPGSAASTDGSGGPSPEIPQGVAAGTSLGASAAYVESPDDVSAPETAAVAGAGAAGAAGAASGEEPDIDSLMAELDKISGEILTRGTTGKKPPSTGGSDEKSS